MADVSKEDAQKVFSLARNSLAAYARVMFHGFQRGKHHDAIFKLLHRLEDPEDDLDRAIIAMPPRHGKSLICSQLFPSWYLGRNPRHEIIGTSYGQSLADDFGKKVRDHMLNPMYSNIFPETRRARDSQGVQKFETTLGGAYFAVGRGGPATGRGGNLIILDDPIKNREEANSSIVR